MKKLIALLILFYFENVNRINISYQARAKRGRGLFMN